MSTEAVLSLPAETDLSVKCADSDETPRLSTLAAIRQFARAYRAVSSSMMSDAPGYVLN